MATKKVLVKTLLEEVLSHAKDNWHEKAEGYELINKEFIDKEEEKFALFTIVKRDKKHVVVIFKRKTRPLSMRCGLTKGISQRIGKSIAESYCYANSSFSFEVNSGGGKDTVVCHHMAFVSGLLLNDPELLEETERFFASPQEGLTTIDPLEIAYSHSLPVLIYGQTGSGKTFLAMEFARKKGLPVYQINFSGGLEDIDLLGKIIPTPEGWKVKDGELWLAFKEAQSKKVIILLEELTRSSRSARNLILKAMDEKFGEYSLHNFLTGESISVRKERILWVATANIGYADTEDIDPALMRRFLIVLHQGYDREKELQILLSIFEDKDKAERFYSRLVVPIRRLYDAGQLRQPLDTGTIKVFAELYKVLQDISLAMKLSIVNKLVDIDSNGVPSEEQQKLLMEIARNFEE